MKRTLTLILVPIFMLALICGCNKENTTVDVAADLKIFRDEQMPSVNEKLDLLKTEHTRFLENSADESASFDEAMDIIETGIMPILAEITTMLDEIDPKSAEVKELRELYKSGIEEYKNGYLNLMRSLRDGNQAGAVEAMNVTIPNADKIIEQYNTKLNDLSKKYETDKGESK